MTGVYSGGLVYEYSQEEHKFGLVTISGSTVSPLPDFQALKAAFAKTPAPAGDGGYRATGAASSCPPSGPNWPVKNNSLPLIPEAAKQFLTNGAGAGRGIVVGDKGSQWSGTPSKSWGEARSSGNGDAGAGKKSNANQRSGPAVLAGLWALAAYIGIH
jgi:hypothetical protein